VFAEMIGESHIEPIAIIGHNRFGLYMAAWMQIWLNPDVEQSYVDLIYGTDSLGALCGGYYPMNECITLR